MCGIVAATAGRNVSAILIEGLKRLEYRGYDSAGLAVLDADGKLNRQRATGKVAELEGRIEQTPLPGRCGVAHTRWATHGKPTEANAHPHMSGSDLALVHNGIIENFETLRAELQEAGYVFTSETDTEVLAHLMHQAYTDADNLFAALKAVVARLDGAFALAVTHASEPGVIVGARVGSPLVVGVGIEEQFIASDPMALLQVTDRFIYLEEGDLIRLTPFGVDIYDSEGVYQNRPIQTYEHGGEATDKGPYRHYMLKEIHEQPRVIAATCEGRLSKTRLLDNFLGAATQEILGDIRSVQIVACGTSYHAGLVARYWIEALAGLPCAVEVASEYRYREHVVSPDMLFVTVSQSGETADTLAALRQAKAAGFRAAVSICNVPGSSMVRESDLSVMTFAGPEIGVASTKAFTTQLVALLMLSLALARQQGRLDPEAEESVVTALHGLPGLLAELLALDTEIEALCEAFADKHHALFLGRGAMYPIAMEGALKLKEISYIHAEAYPAGELKHGPLALVDDEMPVIAVAPNNALLEKLKSNLQEVKARGGQLFVFAEAAVDFQEEEGITLMRLPVVHPLLAPIAYTLPLQLLSYHVAVLKGTDVDQPRNLAKSVTVE